MTTTRDPFLPLPSEPSLAAQLAAENAVLRAEAIVLRERIEALEACLAQMEARVLAVLMRGTGGQGVKVRILRPLRERTI